ncbi:MAG: TonB-dependent receptor [Ignavibacteriae bacterium]|nr:TonB-dependent receptor [Ignavibacteriota bacterium]MCB9208928.1 TonB-dependent receptor [Ignavibacteriales bacterium]MCB9218154.1 TonB-dependent receptor [Ignavibacteriales bacterium]
MNKKNQLHFIIIAMMFLFLPVLTFSQTTGKIAGTVTDAETGEPLIGVNILIEGTQSGAATGIDGSFFIINVPPGTYTVIARMVGYGTVNYTDVVVSVNRTVELAIKMQVAVIEGEEVVVTARAIENKKDQTSSVRNISSDKIEILPVENLEQVVAMQPGVVVGHFRGGRATEVTYLIDGIQVDEAFSGTGKMVTVETEAVQDLEVITGTFNAEYGRAMSGIVNAVTKDGGNKFKGSFSTSFANYFTPNDDIFVGLNSGDMALNLSQDYKIALEGPIVNDLLTFFVNYRHQFQNGHLNGIRRFNPIDYNDFVSDDPNLWHTENTGNGEYVSMRNSQNISLLGKLSFNPITSLRLSYLFTLNDDQGQEYSHFAKYNPDSRGTRYSESYMHAFSVNHMLSNSLFYELKISHITRDYTSYLYEDPLDSRYLHPRYGGVGTSGFSTGGYVSQDGFAEPIFVGPSRDISKYQDLNVKYDLTWQISNHHSIKLGGLYINHVVDQDVINVRNRWAGLPQENIMFIDETGKAIWPFYELELVPKTENTMGIYVAKPWELAAYIQDKMEYDDLVINVGLRYDYFNSKQRFPTDRRNPSNQLNLPDSMMTSYEMADPQTQLSPRLGLAYTLSKYAVLRFSYGHFFQMPPMYALYANNIFRVPVNDFGTTMGNAQLKPQKTITYEIGIWQEIMEGMGLELALFYKDIYDLLSTKVISTYNQIEYGLYTNKDYGNARGLEVKWDLVSGPIFTNINYTLQFTKGNADDPQQTFTRAGNSMDPIKRLLPMSWDQRHTFNASVGYHTQEYGVTVTGYYNSGTPYTFSPLAESPLSLVNLYENNDYQPIGYTVDLAAYYNFKIFDTYYAKLTLNIYNLLDRLNAVSVYGSTGQAYTTVVRDAQIANHHSNYNDYYDIVENPTMYSAPRQIKLGLGIEF